MMSSQKPSEIAQNINTKLERLIPITTPGGIVLGFFLPFIFIHLRPFVPLLFGLMTFSGALKLRAHELGSTVRNPVPIFLFFITAHVIVPFCALLASSLIFTDKEIVTGFVLLFSGPTAVSSFFWILIFNGDKALALTLILLDTMLAPLVVPFTLSILLGQAVSMDMSGIAIALILMVVLPTIIGVSVNEASKEKIPKAVSPFLDPLSKICLILVIAANASPVAPEIQFKDPLVWLTAIVCIVLIFFGFLLIYLIAGLFKFERSKGISLLIGVGLRNNSAIMTIAVEFFPQAVALPVIMSLLFQQTVAAFAGKIFKFRR